MSIIGSASSTVDTWQPCNSETVIRRDSRGRQKENGESRISRFLFVFRRRSGRPQDFHLPPGRALRGKDGKAVSPFDVCLCVCLYEVLLFVGSCFVFLSVILFQLKG